MTADPVEPPIVALDDVGLTYPGPPEVAALRHCTTRIDEGEHVAIVGPSGSGKSTFLNVVGLLDRPTSGTYRFHGEDVASMSDEERTAIRGQEIGFVFQAFHLLPQRAACENVELAQLYAGVPRRARRSHALDALGRVGLRDRAFAPTNQLSGGERQRVAIARALVNRPRLLLCDEPTGNLDSRNADAVLGLLDELHSDGQTLLVITHDARVAARAQRVVTLHDGRVEDERSVVPEARHG